MFLFAYSIVATSLDFLSFFNLFDSSMFAPASTSVLLGGSHIGNKTRRYHKYKVRNGITKKYESDPRRACTAT